MAGLTVPSPVSPLMRQSQQALTAVLLVVLIALLPAVLDGASTHRYFPVELAAYALLLLAAAAGVVRAVIGLSIWGGRWWPLVPVIAAALAASLAVPAGDLLGPAHWSWRVVGWFAVLLLLHRPAPVGLSVLAGLALVLPAQLAAVGRFDRETLVHCVILEILNTGAQVTCVLGADVARRVEESARRSAAREAELRTRSVIADQALAEHQARYAAVADTTVPLLEGLRDGRTRPSDPATQLRCSIEAARLRRLLAEGDDAVDPLVHELRACVEVAERGGVRVDMDVRGHGPHPGPAIRRALTDPVIAALAQARSHARLTVVAAPRDVAVSIVADADPAAAFDPAAATVQGIELDVVSLPGRIWLTATWTAT